MAESVSQASLLREVQEHIQKLEVAINSVNAAREHLKQSTSEVRSDIQSTMTHQLRLLREREVYLLRQVDLAERAKDVILQDQEDQLHETLGSLRNILEVGAAQGVPKDTQECLQDILARLRKQSLVPSEAPHLAFHANLPALHEAITGFGCVDVQKTPLSSGLFRHEPSSASLPKPFEDYDDDDHHVLYRTIGETSNKISVAIPKLSRKPEDWLFMPVDQIQPTIVPSVSANPPGHAVFPPFIADNLGECLDTHSPLNRSGSSAASIHQWLCDIQGQADMEEPEADFEVISPTGYHSGYNASAKESSIEVLSMEEDQPLMFQTSGDICGNIASLVLDPGQELATRNKTLPYFQQILSDGDSKWLLSNVASEASTAYCHEVLRYFREIANDTKIWLHNYEGKMEKPAELCSPSCASPTEPVDIENLDKLLCVKDPPLGYFKQVSSDPENWLLSRKDEDQDLDEANLDEVVLSVCRANEPCQTFQDCVCDDNCCQLLPDVEVQKQAVAVPASETSERVEKNEWLLSTDKPSQTDETKFAPFASSMETQTWLQASPQKIAGHPLSPLSGAFEQISHSTMDQWLANKHELPSGSTPLESLTRAWKAIFCHAGPDRDQKHQPETRSPITNSQWLHTQAETKSTFAAIDGSTVNMNIHCDQKNKTVSWLLRPKPKKLCCKERQWPLPSKQTELPECEDEPTTESQGDTWLSPFSKAGFDNNKWLTSVSPLIE